MRHPLVWTAPLVHPAVVDPDRMTWTRPAGRVEAAVARLGAGPWTRQQLVEHGWTPRQIDRDVQAGRLTRLRRGLFVSGTVRLDWARPSTYAPFLAQSPAGSVVSHESSARVTGLWLPWPEDQRVHLTAEGRPLPSDRAVRRHRAALPPQDIVMRSGVPFTSVERTAIDLALGHGLRQALIALDGAARVLALGEAAWTAAGRELLQGSDGQRLAQAAVQRLRAAVARAAGRTGSPSLPTALPWVDPRSESPYESWSRGVLIDAGLVPEAVGLVVYGASGRRYFADLAWVSRRLLGEVDGLTKYGDDPRTVRERLQAERHRQADLEDAGWRFVRWTAGERADVLVARARRALT